MAGQAVDNDLYLKGIEERLQRLEQRLAVLERQALASASTPESPPPTTPAEKGQRKGSISVVPVLGKAVMALAGAYLLRAITESGSLPTLPLLVIAIGYSAAWLVWAVRTHHKSPFASVVFALTSSFVLAPVLWEGTVRFHQLSAEFVSFVLVVYVALSLMLSRRDTLQAVPSIALLTTVSTDFALLIATHQLVPLIAALMAVAFLVEAAALNGHWQGPRVISALGADFAIAVLGLLMTSPAGAPANYPTMSSLKIRALSLALTLIYTGSLIVRGFGLRKRWTLPEMTQAVVAFALGIWITLRETQGTTGRVLGVLCLVLAMAYYWATLKRFESDEMQRNRRVSVNFAAGLMLTGIFLLLEGDLRALILSVAAVMFTVAFTRSQYFLFAVHGLLFLLVGCVEAGFHNFAAGAMAGTVPSWPHWTIWAVMLAALSCYLIESRLPPAQSYFRVFWMIPPGIAALAVAALAVTAFVQISFADPTPSRLSMVRTILTAIIALALAYLGSTRNRLELGWLAYAAIAAGALKLLLEDLRFGNAGTLMVSLLIYGLILVLLPRVTQFGRVEL